MHQVVLSEGLRKNTAELEELARVTREFLFYLNASMIDFYPKLAKIPKFFAVLEGEVGKDGTSTS